MDINFSKHLEYELEKRKSVNPNYSLRSFAKNLGCSPAVLSLILNGKKVPSPKIVSKIAPKLSLTEVEIENLKNKQAKLKKEANIKSIEKNSVGKIKMEAFSVVSEWQHYAILELFYLDDFFNSVSWMSKKLGISEAEVEKSISNLKSVKLLSVNESGELEPTNNYTILDEYHFTSTEMRTRQKQILELGISKIDKINPSMRDHSSITLTVDHELLPEIKERIKMFRRSLGNFISKHSKNADSVYEIQINMIPLTEQEEGEK